MLKHYMEVRYEGESGPYFYEKEVTVPGISNNPIPEGNSGVCFFDCEVITMNGMELRSERKNETGWYYTGEELFIDDAKAQGKISEKQYDKYVYFGHRRVVITKEGRAIPLWAIDSVVNT